MSVNYRGIFGIVTVVFLAGTLWPLSGCGPGNTVLSRNPDEAWEQVKYHYEHRHWLTTIQQLTAFTITFSAYSNIDSAYFILAKTHEHMNNHILAANSYERLIRDYPNSALSDAAQFGIAESYYAQSPHYQLAQENSNTAIIEYQVLIEEYPNSPYVEQSESRIYELRSKLAQKDFGDGRLYQRRRDYRAAVRYYEFVLLSYYDTPWAVLALFYTAECQEKRKRWTRSLERYAEFLRRYPEHEMVPQAQQKVKELKAILAEEAAKVEPSISTGGSAQRVQ